MPRNQNHKLWRAFARSLSASLAVVLLSFVAFRLQLNLATILCGYLIVIVVLSLAGSFLSSTIVSLVAVGCLAYYLPPIFSFGVANPADIAAIIAFFTTSAVITRLVSGVRKSEAVLRERANLLDLSRDSIFVRDMHNVITYWNRGAEEMYGWTAEKPVGKHSYQLLRTVFPTAIDKIDAELLRTGHWEGELVHTKADGTQVVVASRWSLKRDDRQRPLAILETNTDITERKRAEENLRQSQAHLSEAQRLSHTGSFGWKISTGEIVWSEETFRIFQYDQTTKPTVELVLERIHPEDTAFVKQAVERASQGEDYDLETRLLMPDGAVKCVHIVATANKAESGELEFIGAVMDVTTGKEAENKIKRAEEALRQAQGELAHVSRVTTMGELTASLAHEVNQPLSAVLANGNACLRWLLADPPNLAKAREATERIIRDGKDAGEIVQRVRALFKRTAGEKVALDLNGVIGEVLRLLRGDATRRHIIVETDLDTNLPYVIGDRIQLQQVLLNLVLNGIEAMDPIADRPRKLFIRSARESADAAIVQIRDHGVGIENPAKAFEAFFTTKENGLGMGLAICHSIIDAHRGRIWIASSEGPGATVCFTIPLQSSGAQ
jgi:PAS domain S-box-containing protein